VFDHNQAMEKRPQDDGLQSEERSFAEEGQKDYRATRPQNAKAENPG
jgi:hypothetical protein